jgi:hypothetical protein
VAEFLIWKRLKKLREELFSIRDGSPAAQSMGVTSSVPHLPGSRPQELFPESDTQYFLRDAPTRVIFDVEPDGSVTGLEFITTYVHWHREKNP